MTNTKKNAIKILCLLMLIALVFCACGNEEAKTTIDLQDLQIELTGEWNIDADRSNLTVDEFYTNEKGQTIEVLATTNTIDSAKDRAAEWIALADKTEITQNDNFDYSYYTYTYVRDNKYNIRIELVNGGLDYVITGSPAFNDADEVDNFLNEIIDNAKIIE